DVLHELLLIGLKHHPQQTTCLSTFPVRRERNRQEMIENILSIAREMMRADGVAALRFNAIARRLGMQPPSLYNYFPSKHAIYDALFRKGFEMFDETMRK
ncbi:MAG: TetR family transcriptional regulator, partial [Armatimonadetes bacterium]|nr:TetR family transcriptional regulator [Armatimonadota bacterium]NIO97672.1 TetR family transcriptional regulator [Armatimonadota bacterium]